MTGISPHDDRPAPQFDRFIAMDWSGAGGSYSGIAVAECEPGRKPPVLVRPGKKWRRWDAADWLKEQLTGRERLLIGLDFAFGFPFEPEAGYLGGSAPGIDSVFDLWSLIESRCSTDPDYGCLSFVKDAEYAALFWTEGKMPRSWIARKRCTELACGLATGTHPDTLYKMLHSKQVGKASITGMRVLREVRAARSSLVSVWPFEPPRSSVLVEI